MQEPIAQRVLDRLRADAAPFRVLKSFSQQPGIYAVFLCGTEPLRIGESLLQIGCLLYIGKTESSQMERDAEQHFASGATGHSTLRRSLGALLRTQLRLVPQPRSLTEKSDRAFTHYRFDDAGEDRLTSWMVQNLALSFCEYPEPPRRIGNLEVRLIALAVPPLNIDKNPSGAFRQALKAARAECADLARGTCGPSQGLGCVREPREQAIGQRTPTVNQMFLHDAIVDVLRDCPGHEADSTFIAEEISRRETYIRPKDGMPPEAWQVELRASRPRYSHLFEMLGGGRIRLKEGRV